MKSEGNGLPMGSSEHRKKKKKKKAGGTIRVKRRANTKHQWEPMICGRYPVLDRYTEVKREVRPDGVIKLYYEYEEGSPKTTSQAKSSTNMKPSDLPIGYPAMTIHVPPSLMSNNPGFTCSNNNCEARFKTERSLNIHKHLCDNKREFFCVCGFGPFLRETTFNNHKLECDYTEEHLNALLEGTTATRGLLKHDQSKPLPEFLPQNGVRDTATTTVNVVTPTKNDKAVKSSDDEDDEDVSSCCAAYLKTKKCGCTRAALEQLCQSCQQPICIGDCITRMPCGWTHSAHISETSPKNLDAIYNDLMKTTNTPDFRPDNVRSTTLQPSPSKMMPLNDDSNNDIVDNTIIGDTKSPAHPMFPITEATEPSTTPSIWIVPKSWRSASQVTTKNSPSETPSKNVQLSSSEVKPIKSDKPSQAKLTSNTMFTPAASTSSTGGMAVIPTTNNESATVTPSSKPYTIPRRVKKEVASSAAYLDILNNQDDFELYEFGRAVDEAYKKGGAPAAKSAADQVEKQMAERYHHGAI